MEKINLKEIHWLVDGKNIKVIPIVYNKDVSAIKNLLDDKVIKVEGNDVSFIENIKYSINKNYENINLSMSSIIFNSYLVMLTNYNLLPPEQQKQYKECKHFGEQCNFIKKFIEETYVDKKFIMAVREAIKNRYQKLKTSREEKTKNC